MTNKEINQRIAEACGFVCLHEFQVDKSGAKFGFWEYPPTWTGPKHQPWCLDFCTDLNAMHEAEKMLTYEQCAFFRTHLRERIEDHAASLFVWHSTARQRAEAFLRTLGKWEEVQG
jgi:hypothetical protein